MNITLNISPDCILTAYDKSDDLFTDDTIKKYQFIEFLTFSGYKEKEEVIEDSILNINITTPESIFNNNFKYNYELIKDGDYKYFKFAIEKEESFIEIPINTIYYSTDNLIKFKSETSTIELQLIDLVNDYSKIGIKFASSFFAICNIMKRFIDAYNCSLDKMCNCNKELSQSILERDFLNATIHILSYYIQKNKKDEANLILHKMEHCGLTKKTCDCG